MAENDDDLNAFFDDIQEAEATAVTDQGETPDQPPPAKKHKKDASLVRPRGVVVAAASNKAVKSYETASEIKDSRVPPPPPPPLAPVVRSSVTTASRILGTNPDQPWPAEKEFRLFAGNLDPATNDEQLFQHFAKYTSLNQARVVRDKKGNSKGYGFVSFSDALECAKALRDQDQTWLGSRPIRIKRHQGNEQDVKAKKKDKKRSCM